MKNNVKCSIIIVHYSNVKVLDNCLKSIDVHGLAKSEVIIIDNSLKEYSNKNYRIVNNDKNVGFAKACNQGAFLARGKYIFMLNPDAELTDNFILTGIEILESNNNIGVIAPTLISPSGELQESAYYFPSLKDLVSESFFLDRALEKRTDFGSKPLTRFGKSSQMYADWVCGAAMLMRKEDFLKIGGFDQDYFMYFEDVDLCAKMKNSGKKIIYLLDKYIIHDDKTSKDAFNPKFNSSRKILFINMSIKKYWKKNTQIGINIEGILSIRAFIRVILWGIRYLFHKDEGCRQRIIGYYSVILSNMWK